MAERQMTNRKGEQGISARQARRLRRTIETQQALIETLHEELKELKPTSRIRFKGAVTAWNSALPDAFKEEVRVAEICGCRLLLERRSSDGAIITRAVELL